MSGLREFNIAKIVSDDQAIFKQLINDLFPALTYKEIKQAEFEKLVKDGTK